MDTTTHPGIDTLKIVNTIPDAAASRGVDPLTAAMLGGGNRGGLFGSGGNDIMSLLVGAFLFGGRGLGGLGGWGGVGPAAAGAGAFAAEAVAAQSIFTPKDTAAQLNTFQSWAQTNAATLAQQLCTSSANIISAVNGVNQQMFQAFVAQAQAQTAQLNNMQATLTAQETVNANAINAHINTMEDNLNNDIHDVEKSISAGFSAGQLAECQTQNLVQSTAANTNQLTAMQFCQLARQLAECCCENRLAIANQNALIERNTAAVQNQASANYAALSNQLNMQTCEIKQAISSDGQATRALINDNRMQDLQAQLNDTKAALNNSQQTERIEELVERLSRHSTPTPAPTPITQNVNVTDIATAVARALQQAGAANTVSR
jgi:hypothetical protein